MATLQKEIKITVIGKSANDMLKEIDSNQRTKKQEKFLDSLKKTVKEFEEWNRAGGS